MNQINNYEREIALAQTELLPPSLKVEGNFDFDATRPYAELEKPSHAVQWQQQVGLEGQKHEAMMRDSAYGLRSGLLTRNDNNFNNRRNVNANQSPNNRLEMASKSRKYYRNVFEKITSYENLITAYENAKRHKSGKPYVIEFEKNLKNELFKLQWELMTNGYQPRGLKTFTVRDPKTRKISASDFRDRVVHHAIINQIGPIFEKRFIYDSYANRIDKGTTAALNRFKFFIGKVSRNQNGGFVLKADIRKYFETVDHDVLMGILGSRIKDNETLDLVKVILNNYKTIEKGKGMPLGNLTSQFLANVYLSELDHFVKHQLKAKYYIRYVDDFVILSKNKGELEQYRKSIAVFLSNHLKLSLHPDKTRIISLRQGITFLGFRQFHTYRLLKKSNQRRILKRINGFRDMITHPTSGGGGI